MSIDEETRTQHIQSASELLTIEGEENLVMAVAALIELAKDSGTGNGYTIDIDGDGDARLRDKEEAGDVNCEGYSVPALVAVVAAVGDGK